MKIYIYILIIFFIFLFCDFQNENMKNIIVANDYVRFDTNDKNECSDYMIKYPKVSATFYDKEKKCDLRFKPRDMPDEFNISQ
jgi:thioredoxin-related protein